MDNEVLERLFDLEPFPRVPIIPIVSDYCARVRDSMVAEMMSNPTSFANSIKEVQALFQFDGVIFHTDSTLEAEALGCKVQWSDFNKEPSVSSRIQADEAKVDGVASRGRLAASIEVAKRASQMLPEKTAAIASITGPATLLERLTGWNVAKELLESSARVAQALKVATSVLVQVTNLHCQNKVDSILIVESALGKNHPLEVYSKLEPYYRTITNITDYYQVGTLAYCENCSDVEHITEVSKIGVKAVIASKGADHTEAFKAVTSNGVAYGAQVVESGLKVERDDTGAAPDQASPGYFITGRIPYDCDANNLKRYLNAIRLKSSTSS